MNLLKEGLKFSVPLTTSLITLTACGVPVSQIGGGLDLVDCEDPNRQSNSMSMFLSPQVKIDVLQVGGKKIQVGESGMITIDKEPLIDGGIIFDQGFITYDVSGKPVKRDSITGTEVIIKASCAPKK